MKTMVISLGGSLIVPEKFDLKFLHKFKKCLGKYARKWKFVITCGGGVIARKYISALKYEGKSDYELSLAGIRATRMNALFMMQFFGKAANKSLPRDMEEVKHELSKSKVVICGALRYAPDSTSDSTAARLAHHLNTEFINMTNVKGLYSENPATHKDAKFIPHESWSAFEKRALAIPHTPGQHFVLDQQAAVIIRQNKIKTYIIGKDLKNLEKILAGKKFIGTLIAD
ncbi:UMP kinase [Candidatus Pacearchaeota archaeon]|nr:UMP kinase [Candidatus Pacearchaeota archaeon]